MLKQPTDAQLRQDAVKELVQHRGWKVVEDILEKQKKMAYSDFLAAKTFEEFIKAQAIVKQIEGFSNTFRGEQCGFGNTK